MEGPGVDPPGTAVQRGLGVPKASGASSRQAPGLRLRGDRLPRRGSAPGGGRAPGASDGASLWGSARAPGASDGALLRDAAELRDLRRGLCSGMRGSAGLRDSPTGLCCEVQPGSAVGISRAPGFSDGTLLRVAGRSLRRGFAPGLRTALRSGVEGFRCRSFLRGSGTLLRDSAPGCSRVPGPFLGGSTPSCSRTPAPSSGLAALPAPGSGAPWVRDRTLSSTTGQVSATACGRFPMARNRQRPARPFLPSPGTCPGPTSPGCEPSPALLLLPDTAPRGRGRHPLPVPCPRPALPPPPKS